MDLPPEYGLISANLPTKKGHRFLGSKVRFQPPQAHKGIVKKMIDMLISTLS